MLSRPLHDAFGNTVLKEGQALTDDIIGRFGAYGVDDVFVEDTRVEDISVEPLVEPQHEAQLTQALQTLYNESYGAEKLDDAILDLVVQPVHAMVSEFFPVGLAELNTSPCAVESDHLFRLPARAAGLAMLLAAKCGLDENETVNVGVATALMNVGYVRLPREIVMSREKLTATQLHEFKKHPVHSYVLLRDSKRINHDIAAATLHSHEALNGSGYPQGLTGDKISPIARFVTAADTYFSMISPFNPDGQTPRHDAIEYMMAFGGDLFDQKIVQTMARNVPAYSSGVMVGLNTKEEGIVIEANPGHVGRPKLRITRDKDGFPTKPNEVLEIDLSDPRFSQRTVLELADLRKMTGREEEQAAA